jgi:ubiquinone/menaquinone biosynthesis C-methylase UbiE
VENETGGALIMIENKLTRNYFNGAAEQWKTRQTPEEAKIGYLLSRLDWQRCDTILDIGCGTGVLFPFIEKMTHSRAKIFAIDFAECMVLEAAQKKLPRIEVLCGCARYLPFFNDSIDRIIAFHVLPHIQGKQLALQECWRILKPFGELAIIHLHSSEEINAIHETIGGMVKDHKLPPVEQVCRMLEKSNFEIKDAIDQSGEYFVGGIKILHRETN